MIKRLFFIFITLCISCLCLEAKSLGDIKKDMSKRLPQVTQLKISGKVGESNKGLLAIRGNLNPSEKLIVDNENKDREKVYQSIASKVGQSKEVVAKKRAKQIYTSSKGGIWVQDPQGNWKQK